MPKKNDEVVKLKWIFLFVTLLLVILSFLNYYQRNFEFLTYNILIIIFISFIYAFNKRLKLSKIILLSLMLMILLHLLGGNIRADGIPLWEMKFGIFKYDNFVHALNGFMLVFVAYNILGQHVDNIIKQKPVNLALLLIVVTLGLGVIWELVEFAEVMIIKDTYVGDYVNNTLDILFNAIGAVVGAVSLAVYRRRKKEF